MDTSIRNTFPGLPEHCLSHALATVTSSQKRRLRQLRDFWSRVEVTESCWLWRGQIDRDGYGLAGSRRAHRRSYALFVNTAIEGQILMHACDVRNCVNPAHLRPGTPAENVADAYRKGRKNDRGEANGFAKLTNAEVLEMRKTYAAGGITQQRLAERFGIDQTHVSDIVRGRRWAHLSEGVAR